LEWPLETGEVRRYRKSLRDFQRLASSQLKSCCCGVTLTQCLVLMSLDENGHSTMGQLATNLRLDYSTLSRTVDSLVGQKLVARLRDDSDRRLVWIRLTETGHSACREIHDVNDDYCIQVFQHVPPSERSALIRNFETLIQAYLDHEASVDEQEKSACGS